MKWLVYQSISTSRYLGEVEADTREEAELKAYEIEDAWEAPRVCHQCSDDYGNDFAVIDLIVEADEPKGETA